MKRFALLAAASALTLTACSGAAPKAEPIAATPSSSADSVDVSFAGDCSRVWVESIFFKDGVISSEAGRGLDTFDIDVPAGKTVNIKLPESHRGAGERSVVCVEGPGRGPSTHTTT